MSQEHDALHTLTLCELGQGLADGEFSATGLHVALLARIAGPGEVRTAFVMPARGRAPRPGSRMKKEPRSWEKSRTSFCDCSDG